MHATQRGEVSEIYSAWG